MLSAATEVSGLVPRREQVALSQGQSVGRYVIVSTLGAGGMGVVYKAYDPELDRRVAIKVLRPPLHARSHVGTGRGRLIREAQALAQLQHPNVITVHDVGEHEDRVFIAMEYIDGITLREWSKDKHRSWREVIDVLTAAGRGLQAAHAKQLVHRDFKPDNVMLEGESPAQSGRVLVLDFGLAAGPTRLVSPGATGSESGGASSTATLTVTGAVLGTPAYMAPEQYAAKPSDPRTDQFNFCVTLYETLYGERPFSGDNRAALVAACTSGSVRPAPPSTLVPQWIREVVVRGLAAAPEQRWPSMEVLLAALAHDPTRSRRLRAVLGIGVIAVGLAVGGSLLADRNRLAACRRTAERMNTVWNDEVRARVHAGISSTSSARNSGWPANLR